MRLVLIFALCVAVGFWLAACTPLAYSCSWGEYGPRAQVQAIDLDGPELEELSRLCSKEVEE